MLTDIAILSDASHHDAEDLEYEVALLDSEWSTKYNEFHTGGWDTMSLMNATGDPRDVIIADTDRAVPTPALAKTRALKGALQELEEMGFRIMWARLAKTAPGTKLWEHVDYNELDAAPRTRLHLPIKTNASAALSTQGHITHMAPGHWWRLDPSDRHAARNALGPTRIHLIVDCYFDERTSPALDLVGEAPRDSEGRSNLGYSRRLPRETAEEREATLQDVTTLIDSGFEKAAIDTCLERFFTHDLVGEPSYQMLIDAFERVNDDENVEKWRAHQALTLALTEV